MDGYWSIGKYKIGRNMVCVGMESAIRGHAIPLGLRYQNEKNFKKMTETWVFFIKFQTESVSKCADEISGCYYICNLNKIFCSICFLSEIQVISFYHYSCKDNEF